MGVQCVAACCSMLQRVLQRVAVKYRHTTALGHVSPRDLSQN